MRISFLLLLLLINFSGYSQIKVDSTETLSIPKTPYSKHSFSLKGIMNYPMLYQNNGGYKGQYNNFLDWGLNIDYIYSTSNKFGFGLEYGVNFSNVNVHNDDLFIMESLITSDHLSIGHEGMDIAVQSLLPKIQWKTKNDTGNHGFYHQFGVGISLSHVIKKDYKYELSFLDPTSESFIENFSSENDAENTFDINQFYNYKNKPYLGGSIMYSLTYRGNITKSIQWSVGIRTQLNLNKYNFIKSDYQFDQEDTEYWINRREMRKIIARNRTGSLFHLQFGIVYKLDKK